MQDVVSRLGRNTKSERQRLAALQPVKLETSWNLSQTMMMMRMKVIWTLKKVIDCLLPPSTLRRSLSYFHHLSKTS